MSANIGPLAGIRVLDLGRHISCPTCGMTLGDLGAEVIKVEKTGWGDDTRHSGEHVNGVNLYYPTENRNKKSVTINFRSEAGKELLRKLIETSDVLIENFRPGTMEKMGFGWEEVHRINPQLIMASINGYGEGSPYYLRPGFDSIMAASSGIMDINRSEAGPRITGGIWFIDIMAGMWTTIAVLAALRRRDTSGKGQYIDTAMYDSCLFSLNTFIPFFDQSGIITRNSTKNAYDCPAGLFKSKDGLVICLAGQDGLFNRLLTVMDDPFLHDPKFKDHDTRLMPEYYDLINAAVEREIQKKTGDEWDEIFDQIGVPGGKIKDLGDVMRSPATYARNATVKLEVPGLGLVTFPGTPLHFSDEELQFTPAPDLGEHNEEVYGGLLGLSEEEIQHLKDAGDI
ncbi:MAG: CoA transferase [Oscillibacter sp.]|nr:CoA transferase [Oscillibacter sp.]